MRLVVGGGAGLPIVIRRTQLLPPSAVAVRIYVPTLVSQSRVERAQAHKRTSGNLHSGF